MSDALVPKSPTPSQDRSRSSKNPPKGEKSASASQSKPTSGKNAPLQARGRVLVVDDDPIVLQAVADCLTAAGFEVMTRTQALGTSQWIAQHEVDIILLDLIMPAMSGVDLATFLKKRGLTRKLSVILHSGKRAVELGPLVRQTGALGAIAKTEDTLTFLTEFERLADRHFRTKEGVETAKKATGEPKAAPSKTTGKP
jgi:DNA-binding NtrC family response regulator